MPAGHQPCVIYLTQPVDFVTDRQTEELKVLLAFYVYVEILNSKKPSCSGLYNTQPNK